MTGRQLNEGVDELYEWNWSWKPAAQFSSETRTVKSVVTFAFCFVVLLSGA